MEKLVLGLFRKLSIVTSKVSVYDANITTCGSEFVDPFNATLTSSEETDDKLQSKRRTCWSKLMFDKSNNKG